VETRVAKSIWDFHGRPIYISDKLTLGVETSSRHVPHVSFHGRPHPGVIGTAPSPELLFAWNTREASLAEGQALDAASGSISLPKSNGAYIGQDLDEALREKIYAEGARTAPGREHGGNIDIASLVRGSKVYLVGAYLTTTLNLSLSTFPAPTSPLEISIFAKETASPRRQSKCLE
jgi:formamidase